MSEDIKMTEPSGKTKRKFSMYKEVKENDITKCIKVREIENGYIVTYSKYGYADSDVEHKTYINEEYEKFSETNPFSDKTDSEEEKKVDALVDLFNPPIK